MIVPVCAGMQRWSAGFCSSHSSVSSCLSKQQTCIHQSFVLPPSLLDSMQHQYQYIPVLPCAGCVLAHAVWAAKTAKPLLVQARTQTHWCQRYSQLVSMRTGKDVMQQQGPSAMFRQKSSRAHTSLAIIYAAQSATQSCRGAACAVLCMPARAVKLQLTKQHCADCAVARDHTFWLQSGMTLPEGRKTAYSL